MSELSTEKIDALAGAVAELRDLFVRRLMDDKVKNNAIEKLSTANKDLAKVLEEKQIDSLAKELILLCDRIYQQPHEDDFAWSVLDEILQILSRRGIEQISQLDYFDPHFHNAVSVVPASEDRPAGTIAEVLRHGYIREQRLLRPTDVIIAK